MQIHRFGPALALLSIVGATTTAFGQSDLPPPVEARQHHMQLYAFNLGVLGDMVRGNTDYDAALARAAADRLAALAELSQVGYYPDGTSASEIEGSRALPLLWDERENYDELTGKLADAAAQMASVAGNGLEAVQGEMQALGQSCGACHELYRESDD